jgi:hypothetical protein
MYPQPTRRRWLRELSGIGGSGKYEVGWRIWHKNSLS